MHRCHDCKAWASEFAGLGRDERNDLGHLDLATLMALRMAHSRPSNETVKDATGMTRLCVTHLLSAAVLALAMFAVASTPSAAHPRHNHEPVSASIVSQDSIGSGARLAVCVEGEMAAPAVATAVTSERPDIVAFCRGGCCQPGWMSGCPMQMPGSNDVPLPPAARWRPAVIAVVGDGIDPKALPKPPRG